MIDPLLIATDGLVGNAGQSPFHASVMGLSPFISIIVIDPTVSGGGIGHKTINSETILVSYKGKTVEYNKERDKGKHIIHLTMHFNNTTISKMFLVDTIKSNIVIKLSNFANKVNQIMVSIKNLRQRKISIKGIFGSSDK